MKKDETVPFANIPEPVEEETSSAANPPAKSPETLSESGETRVIEETASEARIAPLFAWLVIYEGEAKGKMFQVFSGQNLIGRGANCQVNLEDDYVSELHAVVREKEGEYLAWDLGSANGTKLNDKGLVGSQELSDDDRIRVGNTTLVFKCIKGIEKDKEDKK
jgi:hypothetical protein